MNTFSTIQSSEGKSILRTQNGAAAVELAILLPFLVVLVFGIIEVGLLLYNQQVITNASREGARAVIVGDCTGTGFQRRPDDSTTPPEGIKQIVEDYCANRLITFAATKPQPATVVSPPWSDRQCGGSLIDRGTNITVGVTYDYSFLLPGILGLGTTKTLAARTVMKMESNEN